MKKLRYLLCLYGVLLLPLTSQALVPTVDESELIPQARHEQAAEIILHIIRTYHYRKRPLDDELSSQILDNYLNSLDQNRSFFMAADIHEFESFRYELDEDLAKSDLDPAFNIFKRYRQRVAERCDFALQLLEQKFDFSIDEEYRFDRLKTDWPQGRIELNELWRKRVKNDFLNLELAGKTQTEIKEILGKRYQRIKTSAFQLNGNDIFQTFINAYTTAIEPHTAYFSPRTSENFDISMSLSLEGIGAVLSSDSDYTEVQKIVTGGPADLGRELQVNDKIVGVGQEEDGEVIDVIGWRLDDVVDLIRGKKGTVVRLEILSGDAGPDSPGKIISITRDKIKLEEQSAQSSIIDIPNSTARIGVIDVPTFYSDFAAQARGEKDYKSTSRDVRKLLADIKTENVDGIIIDLRGNGGGSLSEALELTGLFIEKGPVVQTKDSSGRIEINNDPDPAITYAGPLAVLVDRNSASASEIFAGAIQDYRRGVIIGEPTFGKGTVQNIVDLDRFLRNSKEEHGRLKTTIAQFFRISGGSNQHKGVVPDIIFPTVKFTDEHGERSLDNALPWDQVAPAKFIPANAPVDGYSYAREQHERRISSDKLFQLVLDEMQLSYESSNRKTVSLLVDKRKQESETLKQNRHTLQNAFRIAQGLPPINSDDETGSEDDFEPVDVLLKESARILVDLISPTRTTASNTSDGQGERLRSVPGQRM